jgi:hypothetical protein
VLVIAWLAAADVSLWLGLGLVVGSLSLLHRIQPFPALDELGSQPLREWARHLLLLCWLLVSVQYGVYIWLLARGRFPGWCAPTWWTVSCPSQVVSGCGPGSGRG